MSQVTAPRPSTEAYSAPAKVFVLGEYAVLAGAPAIVAAVGPRFSLRVSRGGSMGVGGGVSPFDSASPAGKLHARAIENFAERGHRLDLELRFEDPFLGAGGFGASSAQFILAYRAFAEACGWSPDWANALGMYRELTGGALKGTAPSGADVVAQWQGGVSLFRPALDDGSECRDLSDSFDWSRILLFSASGLPGRKVRTHEHLAKLSGDQVLRAAEELRDPLSWALKAIASDDAEGLGGALDQYAETLHSFGLELAEAHEDRRALRSEAGVLGVKGTGALLADALIVLTDGEPGTRERLVRAAESYGLREIGPLKPEPGIRAGVGRVEA